MPAQQTSKTAKRPMNQDKDKVPSGSYERAAEAMALRRLLAGYHVDKAITFGDGYGQLDELLKDYTTNLQTITPKLRDAPSSIPLPDASVDLAVVIQMMHRIHDPVPLFTELSRVLDTAGVAVIEVANYNHARNRLKHFLRHKKLPLESVSFKDKRNAQIEYVNHNPDTVRRQLAHAGLKVERILSVSNLRSPALVKIMPKRIMLAIEGVLQPTLANSYFGPSVYFLVGKG
jgi:SAM-dependent methyltransferase